VTQPPRLFQPLALRSLTLDNRIVVSPMCQYSAIDGVPQGWHYQHLGSFAASGPGLVMVEATAVEAVGRITPHCTGLYSDACEHEFSRIVQLVKGVGTAKIGLQLAHAGRKGSVSPPWLGGKPLSPDDPQAWRTVAPSAAPFAPDWPAPKAAAADDLEQIRLSFVQATERARRCGFDLVELHCAHGYLLHEFLSPIANERVDAYGGVLDNRMRFPLEIIRAVRCAWPEKQPLGMRISATDWVEGGFNPDEAARFVAAAKIEGVDYVCVSSGGMAPQGSPPASPPGYQVQFAQKIRDETGMTTRAVGMIFDPPQAEAILAEGKADFIALARAFIDDPRWVWHAAEALGVPDLAWRPPQYRRAAPDVWPGAAIGASRLARPSREPAALVG
jgi:2,4-dienoyl-CoA reductase-like NADH-dependent reductase (Old Yellow Enzyme family)